MHVVDHSPLQPLLSACGRVNNEFSVDAAEPLNIKRIRRLMRVMGLEAVGPKPNLSKPQPGHTIYPYLLRGVAIERVNQVWSTDITARAARLCADGERVSLSMRSDRLVPSVYFELATEQYLVG